MAAQTLLGVTGSGKTFTIANVIEKLQRPTLVMAPNKTLAAQLYGEFKNTIGYANRGQENGFFVFKIKMYRKLVLFSTFCDFFIFSIFWSWK